MAVACYNRARRFPPGSVHADASEHAVTLCFNRTDADKPAEKLLDDVLRNSYHSVRRSRKRGSRTAEECARLGADGVSTGGCSPLSSVDATVDACLAGELLGSLQDEAARVGQHGPTVLAGLIAGDTTSEIATRAKVSSSTVDRTIKRLRRRATADGYGIGTND